MQTMFNHTRDTFIQSDSGHVYKTSRDCVSPKDKILPARKAKLLMREHALQELHKILSPGDTVHGIVRSVARSGMSRRIDFYKLTAEGPLYLTGYFADVYQTDDFDGGMRVNGCGMDMIFDTVYNIGSALWPQGFTCPGDKLCRSNDHSNGDRNYAPHTHNDGGYALKHAQI